MPDSISEIALRSNPLRSARVSFDNPALIRKALSLLLLNCSFIFPMLGTLETTRNFDNAYRSMGVISAVGEVRVLKANQDS